MSFYSNQYDYYVEILLYQCKICLGKFTIYQIAVNASGAIFSKIATSALSAELIFRKKPRHQLSAELIFQKNETSALAAESRPNC